MSTSNGTPRRASLLRRTLYWRALHACSAHADVSLWATSRSHTLSSSKRPSFFWLLVEHPAFAYLGCASTTYYIVLLLSTSVQIQVQPSTLCCACAGARWEQFWPAKGRTHQPWHGRDRERRRAHVSQTWGCCCTRVSDRQREPRQHGRRLRWRHMQVGIPTDFSRIQPVIGNVWTLFTYIRTCDMYYS